MPRQNDMLSRPIYTFQPALLSFQRKAQLDPRPTGIGVPTRSVIATEMRTETKSKLSAWMQKLSNLG